MKIIKETKRVCHDTYVEEVVCDICKASSKSDSWYIDTFTSTETSISYKETTCYPDDYWTRGVSVDICPKCFENKLIPWLKVQGVNAEIKDNL